VTINGNQEAVLAESPRKAVVEMPTDAEGPVAIHVRKGAAEATGVVRSIAVKLSAPRLNLRPGEVTTMTAEVRGLSGLTTDIPLSLTNRSDAVVGLEGGEQQRLLIHPEDAGPGGIYTTTRTLTGRAVGAYNLTAVVSEPKPVFLYHGALLDHDFNPLDNVPPDIKRRFYAEVDNPPANPPIFADDEGLPLPPPSKVKLGGDKKPDEGKAPEGGKPPEREMTAYMRDCVDAEVPLPPPWGKNGDGGWKKQPNDLPPDKTLVKLGAQTSVEVWIYESEKPPGICYALPRKDSTGKIIAMGVICQGKSGSACFWDNKGADGSTPIPVEPGLDPSKMADGRNLKEQCVNCHRGDNAFVITPGTPLVAKPDDKDQPTDLPPGKRPYKPIDGPKDAPREGWTNDKGDLKLSISGCTSCHAVPKLTVPYCRIMNKMFVTERSMPPAGDYSDDEAADVNNDLQQIIAACKKIPPPPGYQWQPDPYKWTPPPPPPK
jgi:hypothetical protein